MVRWIGNEYISVLRNNHSSIMYWNQGLVIEIKLHTNYSTDKMSRFDTRVRKFTEFRTGILNPQYSILLTHLNTPNKKK